MYQIVTDGSCDLDQSIVDHNAMSVVPFYITKDGKTHQKEKVDTFQKRCKDREYFLINNS